MKIELDLNTGKKSALLLFLWEKSKSITSRETEKHILITEKNPKGRPELPGKNCLVPDMEDGIRRAVLYLQEKGRKQLALCIPGKCPDWCNRLRRINAFRQVLGENALICEVSHDMLLREAMIRELLPFVKEHGVDALLMSNDRFAMCGMQLLIANGYRIPEDLAVIGYDNDPSGMESTPTLSSIAWDAALIARQLFDLLDEQLASHQNIGIKRVPVDLILRNSC